MRKKEERERSLLECKVRLTFAHLQYKGRTLANGKDNLLWRVILALTHIKMQSDQTTYFYSRPKFDKI